MNEYLTPINEPSDNKEITPTGEIPDRITIEHDSLNDYATVIYEELDKNKEVTPTDMKQKESTPPDGMPARITIEHDSFNDYATVIYEELDKNIAVTPTDMKKQFSRLVWF